MRSLPFSEDFADFRCPKEYMRGSYEKVEMRRPKFIVAVVWSRFYVAVVNFGSYALLGGIFLSCIA